MTLPRYGPGSNFESCPAATGREDPARQCGTYPDRCHRCANDRLPHAGHRCLCGYRWVTVEEQVFQETVQALAELPRPRHAAP